VFVAKDLRPMLATLPAQPPSLTVAGFVYEPKYDGIRAIVEVVPGTGPAAVRLWSRNGNEKTAQFPDLVDAVGEWGRHLPGPVVLDGEVTALDAKGKPTGFQRLQHRIHVSVPGYRSNKKQLSADEQPVALIVFDLLRDDGHDLRALSLTDRRARLEALFTKHKPNGTTLWLTEQSAGTGEGLMARARKEEWEGLIVKSARSPYRAGKRSPEWMKLKLQKNDEFVIGGWTAPQGTRTHFGALILGLKGESGVLEYAGDVGTGFTGAELSRLMELLKRIETPTCPFSVKPKVKDTAHWVKPVLVAQIRYTEMTDEGRLRHPTYLGLRDDKPAKAVTVPKVPKVPTVPTVPKVPKVPKVREGKVTEKDVASLIEQLNALEKVRKNGKLTLPDGDTLEVTNLHKIFWPEGKQTKGDLIRHYARMAPYILPVIDNRPLVMKRLPNGVDAPFFYQHRAPDVPPPGVRSESLADDDVPSRLIGGSLKTLLYMAQLASISMDPWFSTMDDLDAADQVAIDLDPQPGATFSQILDVARWVQDELDRVDVPGFPKTSGSEGLHIFIPLPKGTPYQAGMLFCQIIATMVATKHPKVATVERTVRKRKEKTIYVDYLQNIQGKTLACAYSARASAFAGVSTPLTWKEVHDSPAPQDFTIDTIGARLGKTGDLWKKLLTHKGANLLAAIEKLSK
jgi:bifunctional non-homologous end joining protein LigD